MRVSVIGLGLIGASVCRGLSSLGHRVSGSDLNRGICSEALALGVIESVGLDPEADLAVVAVPVDSVVGVVRQVLQSCPKAFVTDVGSTKAFIVAEVDDPRFCGGHPMAGSEQSGLGSASGEIFNGATWVLTPSSNTSPECFASAKKLVSQLGAEVATCDAVLHDRLVAQVSHVPHLTAVTLMDRAQQSSQNPLLMRLAAGGFRDMTRIAAGDPSIWPSICVANRKEILSGLDELLSGLGSVRSMVEQADTSGLLELFDRASLSRRSLPTRFSTGGELLELRVVVSDRPGVLAQVTALAAQVNANIADIEIAHSTEGDAGVVVLTGDLEEMRRLATVLVENDYRVGERRL